MVGEELLCWDSVHNTPACAPGCDAPVMCDGEPCLDLNGDVLCAPQCETIGCEDCPKEGQCGEVVGGSDVCVHLGKVLCKPCTALSCQDCPSTKCEEIEDPFCIDPETGLFACVQDLMFCEELGVECATDAECGGGAPTCVNGACRAMCETTDDCGLKSPCLDGICVDGENHPVCAVIPHESGDKPPAPACEPLGPCMNDTDCPAGASTCWDFLKMGPVVAGEPGQCVSACASPDECPAGITCSSKGFCADDQTGLPVCTQP